MTFIQQYLSTTNLEWNLNIDRYTSSYTVLVNDI